MATKDILAMRSCLLSPSLAFTLTVGCADGVDIDARGDGHAMAEQKSTVDYDGDGFTEATGDCDETNVNVNPGQVEVCDGADNDCDCGVDGADGDSNGDGIECGSGDLGVDNLDSSATETIMAPNVDGDGFPAESGWIFACDEDFETVYAEFVEATGGDASLLEYWEPVVTYEDTDGDGYDDTPVWDCNDAEAAVYPGAEEVCDGMVNDCDSTSTTPDDGLTFADYYADSDGDTFGDAGTTTNACAQPDGYVSDDTDCDDTDAAVNPAATESCNDVDDDCDGLTDDDDTDVEGESTWYYDGDSDGSGSTTSWDSCDAPMGYVANSDDCDDAEATVYLGADELCDEMDNDCDGTADEDATDQTTWYRDYDADGYGRGDVSAESCDQPSGYVSQNGDCDDAEDDANPGEVEVYDGIDNDCDGDPDDGVLCSGEVGYDSTTVWVSSMVVSGTPSGVVDGEWADVDGDGLSDTEGVSFSSDNYGGLYLATATTETFCLGSGEAFLVDVTLSDGSKGCVEGGTAEGSLYALQDGVSLSTAAYDNGDGTCQIEVSVP